MWSGGRVWCGSGKMSLAEELASRAPVGRILISRQKLAKTDSKDRQQKLVSTRNSEKTPFVPTTGKHNFNRTKLRQPTALANTQADGEHQMFSPFFPFFLCPPSAVCCFGLLNRSLGNRSGLGASSCQQTSETWSGWILTLHLNYVAGYTDPLLFLSKRTQHE